MHEKPSSEWDLLGGDSLGFKLASIEAGLLGILSNSGSLDNLFNHIDLTYEDMLGFLNNNFGDVLDSLPTLADFSDLLTVEQIAILDDINEFQSKIDKNDVSDILKSLELKFMEIRVIYWLLAIKHCFSKERAVDNIVNKFKDRYSNSPELLASQTTDRLNELKIIPEETPLTGSETRSPLRRWHKRFHKRFGKDLSIPIKMILKDGN